MRRGASSSYICIAMAAALAIFSGLSAIAFFHLGNMWATDQQRTVNQSGKTERLSFADQTYAVERSQKADPLNITVVMISGP